MPHLLCFGYGFTAAALTDLLDRDAWTVTGTATTREGAARIDAKGVKGLVFDGEHASAEVAAAILRATHVLLSIPPGAAGDPAFIHHSEDIARSTSVMWIGYLSTIGVYGDHDGMWIDETSQVAPVSERGHRRLAAETAWQDLGARAGKRVQVFRLPGIYGPGRSAIDSVRAGSAKRIVKRGQVFNRIHVDDIAGALALALAGRGGQDVYNIVDDEPAPPQDVVAHAARLLAMEPPPEIAFEDARLSPMAASFYGENKRVSNARAKADLGWSPRHPTYREGLAAILAGER
jgi:nucleoside-diphosphate-sugar epimerase